MAQYTTPPLTTIRQSGHEMGYQTTTLLIDMIENELAIAEVEDLIMTPTLVARRSTGKLLD